ncbi:hypothetical protein M514_25740 [Trichuris suis]|uniref:Uncharacterized protein n=1 Tax=Trichuris suis TaxID=68888 RepID=A0A085MY42_9BILA|nr:hypothetical protein M514_25740 [Trichuris suis]
MSSWRSSDGCTHPDQTHRLRPFLCRSERRAVPGRGYYSSFAHPNWRRRKIRVMNWKQYWSEFSCFDRPLDQAFSFSHPECDLQLYLPSAVSVAQHLAILYVSLFLEVMLYQQAVFSEHLNGFSQLTAVMPSLNEAQCQFSAQLVCLYHPCNSPKHTLGNRGHPREPATNVDLESWCLLIVPLDGHPSVYLLKMCQLQLKVTPLPVDQVLQILSLRLCLNI